MTLTNTGRYMVIQGNIPMFYGNEEYCKKMERRMIQLGCPKDKVRVRKIMRVGGFEYGIEKATEGRLRNHKTDKEGVIMELLCYNNDIIYKPINFLRINLIG